MHLLAIALLSILAGTLLLAKFRKEMAGKFFVFISWFFIVVGFILFVGFIAGGICRMSHHHGFGRLTDGRHEMMMKDFNPGMPGAPCCPQGMDRQMCPKEPGCSQHDCMMKCCARQVDSASAKVPVPKK